MVSYLYRKNIVFPSAKDGLRTVSLKSFSLPEGHYVQDPQPIIPAAKSGKGRKPVKLKAQTASTRVDKLVKAQPGDAWKRIKVRETTKG